MRRMSALEFAGWKELYRLEHAEEEARARSAEAP